MIGGSLFYVTIGLLLLLGVWDEVRRWRRKRRDKYADLNE